MARRASTFVLLLLTTMLVGCDHATKLAATALLSDGRNVSIAPGVLELTYARNFDTAFSLTSRMHHPGKSFVLVALMVLALAALVVAWARASRGGAPAVVHVGFSFLLAGALGNLIDRAMRGYVVDFVYLHHWPVFNVADVLIVIGGLLLAYAGLVRARAKSLDRSDVLDPP